MLKQNASVTLVAKNRRGAPLGAHEVPVEGLVSLLGILSLMVGRLNPKQSLVLIDGVPQLIH